MKNSLACTAQKTRGLLDEARTFLLNSGIENYQKAAKEIPQNAIAEDENLSIVFAGQYSAGKSSILSLLTGEKLDIGEGIVTNETHKINWNGITVIDTPGIHTGLREDHDAITYDAISKADLIVYVITQSLFTPLICKNFRKLAFTYGKKNDIMLIVNKMNDCEDGNTPEARRIKTESISGDLAPAAPEDFLTTFISAEDWFDAQTTDNERRKNRKLQDANIDELIAHLNQFVCERKLCARFTTSLYTLNHQLEILLASENSGDDDMDAFCEHLRRRKASISEAVRNIRNRIDYEVDSLKSFIRQQGAELANSIEVNTTEADFEDKKQQIDAEIKQHGISLENNARNIIETEMTSLARREKELRESNFSQKLMERLEIRIRQYNPVISPETSGKIAKIGAGSEKFGETLSGFCVGKGGSGLTKVSGSVAHDAVLKIGHLLGHKFKPWEALKITKGISTAAKCLSVAGALISLGLQAKEDYDQQKILEILRKNRDSVRDAYITATKGVGDDCKQAIEKFISEHLQPELNELEERISVLNQIRRTASTNSGKLLDLRTRTMALISEIQSAQ